MVSDDSVAVDSLEVRVVQVPALGAVCLYDQLPVWLFSVSVAPVVVTLVAVRWVVEALTVKRRERPSAVLYQVLPLLFENRPRLAMDHPGAPVSVSLAVVVTD